MAYEMCSSCRGSGVGYSGEGIGICYECKGDTVVIKRDSKGRFTK